MSATAAQRRERGYDKQYRSRNAETLKQKDRDRYVEKRRADVIRRANDRSLQKNYGITRADWNGMFKLQEGKCLICQQNLLQCRIHVDHNHETGRVRGLLCHHCNTALGNFRDNVEIVRRAAAYLERDIALLP